ncbi:MAG: hypothetical protein AAF485_22345, partial [Chloroflexota bacterium]
RIKESDLGGLIRIDVPMSDEDHTKFRTEFLGPNSIFRIRVVSEEIARAYAEPIRDIFSYGSPVISRDEHERLIKGVRVELIDLRNSLAAGIEDPNTEEPF